MALHRCTRLCRIALGIMVLLAVVVVLSGNWMGAATVHSATRSTHVTLPTVTLLSRTSKPHTASPSIGGGPPTATAWPSPSTLGTENETERVGRDTDNSVVYQFTAEVPPRHAPHLAYNMSGYGLRCSQAAACAYYGDVLLILKLNPVRMLWLDLLLRYYSVGFPNIVFWSTLRGGDTTLSKKLYVGKHRIPVHLMDDNQGFCDHHTVALSMKWWPQFAGYIFLSDDVLYLFWQTLQFPKARVWRQAHGLRYVDLSSAEMDPKMRAVLQETELGHHFGSPARLPFAATSGLYYVPHRVADKFFRVSEVLLRHRTYNEWGTPFVLQAVDNKDFVPIPGKLVWKHRRLQNRANFDFQRVWLHPVRASGELFARLTRLVHTTRLHPGFDIPGARFWGSECFQCSRYPKHMRRSKGLYHTCRYVPSKLVGTICGAPAADLSTYAVGHFPEYRHAYAVGGWVVLTSNGAAEQPNALELEHEGFWNANITTFVFQKYYPLLNRSTQRHPFLEPYPECCTVL